MKRSEESEGPLRVKVKIRVRVKMKLKASVCVSGGIEDSKWVKEIKRVACVKFCRYRKIVLIAELFNNWLS